MIAINKRGVLMTKTDLHFENEAVLNPSAFQEGNTVHLFYRAVSTGDHSTIGYCRLEGPYTIVERSTFPVLFPEFEHESCGVEDPRIVKIEDLFYLTYTAYNGVNALGAVATSKDLKVFEKLGIMVPPLSYKEFTKIIAPNEGLVNRYSFYYTQNIAEDNIDEFDFIWDKDVMFFPRRINGKIYFLHRIKPDIQLAAVSELSDLTREFWVDHVAHLEENTVLKPKFTHEILHIGGGAPPIETEIGWLVIYHGVYNSPEQGNIYSACAALLDLDNPLKELARLPYPLFSPEHDWELNGKVSNVCFPSGTSLFGDMLTIYYGAADEQIAYATISMTELLKELTLNIGRHENETKNR